MNYQVILKASLSLITAPLLSCLATPTLATSLPSQQPLLSAQRLVNSKTESLATYSHSDQKQDVNQLADACLFCTVRNDDRWRRDHDQWRRDYYPRHRDYSYDRWRRDHERWRRDYDHEHWHRDYHRY